MPNPGELSGVVARGLGDGGVVRLEFRRNVGSALSLGPRRLLTCLHVVRGTSCLVDGVRTRCRIVARGAREGDTDGDWAVLEVDREIRPPPGLLLGGVPPPGSPIALLGYWAESSVPAATVVAGRVDRIPRSWRDRRRQIIVVRASMRRAYLGMSGGPAVIHGASGRRVVGIYVGYASGLHLLHVLPSVVRGLAMDGETRVVQKEIATASALGTL